MALDLIGDERLARKPHRFIDQRYREIRDTNMARQAELFHLAQCRHRFR